MEIAINPAAPTPEHLAQLDAARLASKKIKRAVSVANFDGWTIGAFAAITIAFSLTSPSAILLGLGMTYVAWRELSSGAALRKLELDAPRRLAINQVVLFAVLSAYFAWRLYVLRTGPSFSSQIAAQEPDAEGMIGDWDQPIQAFLSWFYIGLILGSAIFQGSTAWYYLSREKVVSDYLTKTPQWIIDYQRGGGTL